MKSQFCIHIEGRLISDFWLITQGWLCWPSQTDSIGWQWHICCYSDIFRVTSNPEWDKIRVKLLFYCHSWLQPASEFQIQVALAKYSQKDANSLSFTWTASAAINICSLSHSQLEWLIFNVWRVSLELIICVCEIVTRSRILVRLSIHYQRCINNITKITALYHPSIWYFDRVQNIS